MSEQAPPNLTRREREIMDILYQAERATAAAVQEAMQDAPSYSTVRTLLRLLEERGHVTHEQDGPRYVYQPSLPRNDARKSALSHLVNTFFGGSAQAAILNLVENSAANMSPSELDHLQAAIEKAKKEGR